MEIFIFQNKIKFENKNKNMMKKQTPGPGAYSPWCKTSKVQSNPSFSMGKATRKSASGSYKLTPGPGQYEIKN